MKHLVLMRHAQAAFGQDGQADHARPLTAQGAGDALRVAQALRADGAQPQVLLTSPALRALSTARHVAQGFGLTPAALALDARLYEAQAGTVLGLLQALDPRWEEVLVVGHNPSISQLARLLAPCPFLEVPPAGAVRIALPVQAWTDAAPGCGELLAYHQP